MDQKYRKGFRKNGDSRARIGIPLGIHDRDKRELCTGDLVRWHNTFGRLLFNKSDGLYWFFIWNSRWYGDDEYDSESYGKGWLLPMDDGARMEMKYVEEDE